MQAAQTESVSSKPPVDFLWLELTNRCNLQCIHCYADSGPQAEKGTLSTDDYIRLMTEAFALGCRRVQFIGGEPTLNRGLPVLIRTASEMGFEFIEIYTNLTILPEELLQCFVAYRVHVATSIYGPAGERHDAITLVDGSFEKTIRNLRRIMAAGLPVRASIIQMEANAAYTDSTVTFLREIGVRNVSVGGLRRIGRGAATCESSEMSELCGNCAGSTLCVSPTGVVSPCIMSKKWSVGSIADASLSDIATGDSLRETRQRIYDAVVSRQGGAGCMPAFSNRHASCAPSYNAVGAAADPSCRPGAINARTACAPQFASAMGNVGTDCPPSFNAIGANKPCFPTGFASVEAECGPSFNALDASSACTPVGVMGVAADCAPAFNAIGANKPCLPTGAASVGADCGPSFNSIGANAPCTPTGVMNAGADCAPTFNAIGANKPCTPTGFASAEAQCGPSFNAIDASPACTPVGGMPVGADCTPAFTASGASPACTPVGGMGVGADCSPSFGSIAASAACGPTAVLNVGHDCPPTFNAIAAAPCSPTGVMNANANCSPTFSSVASSLACQPSLAPGVDCSPTFSAIAASAPCAPAVASGVTRIGADCQPAFYTAAKPVCGPTFAPDVSKIGADRAPAFNAVVTKSACDPSIGAGLTKRSPSVLTTVK
jgi:sulfatase maturation enzyme AslB (radical SAM superfamily)